MTYKQESDGYFENQCGRRTWFIVLQSVTSSQDQKIEVRLYTVADPD